MATTMMATANSISPVSPAYTCEDQALANAINQAARQTNKRFGDRKAFICGVLEHPRVAPYVKRYGRNKVCQWMAELNRLDLIEMVRADLVSVMDPAWVRDSEIRYVQATFHFVVYR